MMKTRRKLMAVVLLLTMLVAALSVSSAMAEAKTVHFYAWTNPDNMVSLLDAFNKEYAGKYEMVYEKLADAATLTINTALSSGDPIDVMTQASAMDLRVRADDNVYLGLKQFFDQEGWTYAEKMGDSIEQTMNINGEYYAIPYCNNINMVFFNKNMFDAAGLAYPESGWTWEDFRQTAIKLTHGEGAEKIYGAMLDICGSGGGGGDNYWDTIARQKLGAFAYYTKDFSATTFDTPEMKESLDFFYKLAMEDKCIVPYSEYQALQYYKDPTGMAGLYNGKFAMWVAPVYGCLYLKASYGEVPEGTDIGIVDMPTVEGGQTVTTCYTSTASIPANAPDPQAAWDAIKYITVDRADLFAGPKAMHPGYQFATKEEADAFNSLIFSEKPGLDYDMAMAVMAKDRVLVSKDNTIKNGQVGISEAIQNYMTLVFNGELEPAAALAKIKADGDAAIKADAGL